MKLATTILIQLFAAAVCNKSQSLINLTALAEANGISNTVQNRVIALSKHSDSIDDIQLTIEGIITEAEIETTLLTEA